MKDNLLQRYKIMFDEEIELPEFLDLDEDEQIKILKECLNKRQPLYLNDYFNNNYIENVD